MSDISISKVFGDIGERFTENYLSNSFDSYVRADEINFLGQHLLDFDIDVDFDLSDIRKSTEECRTSGFCGIPSSKRPCLKDIFYEPNNDPVHYLDHPDTGDDKFRWYCSLRLTKLDILSYDRRPSESRRDFISDYMICHYFIENYYNSQIRSQGSLFTAEEFSHVDPYWHGHPGRLDFFAKLGSQYYCLDSKVNTSTLSLWQQIRMAWMKRCGHTAQIYNVRFRCVDKEDLIKVYLEEGVDEALFRVNPELEIIDYEPSNYPDAEKFVSNEERFIQVAQSDFIWF